MKNYIGSQQHFEDNINAHYDKKREIDEYYRQQEIENYNRMYSEYVIKNQEEYSYDKKF